MYDLADFDRMSVHDHVHDVNVLQIMNYRHRRSSSAQAMLLSLAINSHEKRPEVIKNHRAELSVPVQAASCLFVLCMMQSSDLLVPNILDLQKCCMFIQRPRPWYDQRRKIESVFLSDAAFFHSRFSLTASNAVLCSPGAVQSFRIQFNEQMHPSIKTVLITIEAGAGPSEPEQCRYQQA
jgi:hypothetical protein